MPIFRRKTELESNIKKLLEEFLEGGEALGANASEEELMTECARRLGLPYTNMAPVKVIQASDYVFLADQQGQIRHLVQIPPVHFFKGEPDESLGDVGSLIGKHLGDEIKSSEPLKVIGIFRGKHLVDRPAAALERYEAKDLASYLEFVRTLVTSHSRQKPAEQAFQEFVDWLDKRKLIIFEESDVEAKITDLIERKFLGRPDSQEELEEMHAQRDEKLKDCAYRQEVRKEAIPKLKKDIVGEALVRGFKLGNKWTPYVAGEKFFIELNKRPRSRPKSPRP